MPHGQLILTENETAFMMRATVASCPLSLLAISRKRSTAFLLQLAMPLGHGLAGA